VRAAGEGGKGKEGRKENSEKKGRGKVQKKWEFCDEQNQERLSLK
jgi:hypothetical protein